MTIDLPKQYQPAEAQTRWLAYWRENHFFDANPNPAKKPHTIMIPLPNVTGALHMGHALNGTLQDLITRYRRMQGYEALWMPGTDHAGIATQAVVERRMLEEEGLTRHDIGREALVNRIWKWKDAYEARILNQLQQLGASCDWRRVRFTLDEVCSRAVRRTFFRFFKDGLIYRGKRLVNWDTFLQTAVADDEVFHEEVEGHFWTFTYPVVGDDGQLTGETIAFSTTRPETMLGDTAVCVHPTDERYQHLVGKKVRIPLMNRDIPIVADALLAKKDLGTGCVKVTPAHDPNDYQCGLRNNLPMINILNPDGTINAEGGAYQGLDRYDARQRVVEDMTKLGHFVTVEPRKIELAHSDRSKTAVEPYLSDQWFVKMGDISSERGAEVLRDRNGNVVEHPVSASDKPGLAQMAIDAANDRRVRFFPLRYQRTYLDWLSEKRDWCISRQLWWGHRIPVWSKVFPSEHDRSQIPAIDLREQSPRPRAEYADYVAYQVGPGQTGNECVYQVCVDSGHEDFEEELRAAGFKQDEDVLDTWFSSALWPHATLGWPDLEHNPPLIGDDQTRNTKHQTPNTVLPYFYPGSVLITSRDIITLWVARMVLMGLYNMGDVPFRHVHVHPKILDGFGQTMSKSKGNGCDPMDLIDRYGTDAVRFTIASFAGETQDVKLPMAYECPHCQNLVPQALDNDGVMVKPETVKQPLRGSSGKLKMTCPKCKKQSQFSTPQYEPDPGEPVAKMVSERFEFGRNFCNKLWNAARFAMMNLEGYTPGSVSEDDLRLEDRWILSRLSRTASQVTTHLDRYEFDEATRKLRDFTWNEFCDWYVEMIKPRLRDESLKPVAQRVLVTVLDGIVRLLQPFTPFICEELWQLLKQIAPERGLFEPKPTESSVMIAAWPVLPAEWQSDALEARFNRLQETVVAVRNIRSIYGIAPGEPIRLHLRCSMEVASELQGCADQFDNLAKAVLEAAGADVSRPNAAASFSLADADGFVPLQGLIDVTAELDRQKKEADKLRGFIRGHQAKLTNESFVSKAPEQVVAQVRETLAGLQKQLESVEAIITQLGAG